jgi:hypothetical protein
MLQDIPDSMPPHGFIVVITDSITTEEDVCCQGSLTCMRELLKLGNVGFQGAAGQFEASQVCTSSLR